MSTFNRGRTFLVWSEEKDIKNTFTWDGRYLVHEMIGPSTYLGMSQDDGAQECPKPLFLSVHNKALGHSYFERPPCTKSKNMSDSAQSRFRLSIPGRTTTFPRRERWMFKGLLSILQGHSFFWASPRGGVPFWMFWEAKKKITTWYFQNFPIASDYCKWPIHLNPCLLLEGVTLWSLTLGSAVSRFLWPCGIVWKHLDTSGLNQRDGREKKRKWQDTGHHQITSASEASKGLKLLKICWTMLNSCNEVRQETGDPAGLCCSGGPWWHLESRVFWVRSFALLTCITVFYHIVSLAASLQWG